MVALGSQLPRDSCCFSWCVDLKLQQQCIRTTPNQRFIEEFLRLILVKQIWNTCFNMQFGMIVELDRKPDHKCNATLYRLDRTMHHNFTACQCLSVHIPDRTPYHSCNSAQCFSVHRPNRATYHNFAANRCLSLHRPGTTTDHSCTVTQCLSVTRPHKTAYHSSSANQCVTVRRYNRTKDHSCNATQRVSALCTDYIDQFRHQFYFWLLLVMQLSSYMDNGISQILTSKPTEFVVYFLMSQFLTK